MSDSHATSPTFADVTRDVARTLAPPGNLYFGWMSVVALILTAGIVAWTGQMVGHGDGRQARAPDVGDVHHELRVLDRHRPRGHTDLRDPLPLSSALADVDLPRGGGDDDLRRDDGGALPADPRRAHVVRLLPAAVPEPAGPVAELPVAARLGRVRDLDLPLDQHGVLHRRAGPRHRGAPRRVDRLAAADLRDARAQLGGRRLAVAPLPARLRPAGLARDAARPVGPQRGVVGLRDGARSGLALDPLRAVLRGRRHLLGLRDGADPRPAHAPLLRAPHLHPGEAPGRDGEAHPGDGSG